jgi:hypothetical protein
MTHTHRTVAGAKQIVAVALLFILCARPACAQGTFNESSAQEAPFIIFTSVPPFGSTSEKLSGRALNINPSDYRIAVFLFVPDVGWYTKPFCDPSLITISADGTFSTSVVTGGVDETATQYAAYIVPSSFSHPCVLGAGAVPNTVEGQALAKATVGRANPNQKMIRFSGYDWFVKTNVGRVSPGPNLFSDRPENVWVDAQGHLHLRITNRDGRWYAAEVLSDRTFGLGAYRFFVDGAVDDLDPNIVFGLFTFGADPAFGHRELDVELSRFGNAGSMNAQYVVQPFNVSGNIRRFQTPAGINNSVHGFDWKGDRVNFESHRGSQPDPPDDASVIQKWTYSQTVPNTLDEKAHINLWLFNDAPPSDGKEREVVVDKFQFTPASADTAPPELTDPQVGAATSQPWGGLVPLRVAVADNTGVARVWAEVTRPDAADERIDLTRAEGTDARGVWSGTYRAPSNGRAFNVTFFARDASQNQGRSALVNFALAPNTSIFYFGSANYVAAEDSGKAEVTVVRSGDISSAASVDYATTDGTASERSDYSTALGTLRFQPGEAAKTFTVLITDDGDAQGDETVILSLTNAAGAALIGAPARAFLTITDDQGPSTGNPIDDSQFFVRQHYADFLNREPDPPGLAFWTNELESCGADSLCQESKRIHVSAAFFLSIEFQQTGYMVYRLHQAAFGAGPLLNFRTFVRDTQEVGRGVVVLAPGWEQQLEANKQAFVAAFAARPEFTARYPQGMSAALFVDSLNANAGGPLSRAERDALVADLTSGAKTRAQALRVVADHPVLVRREFNRAFVYMQFVGYLRRGPSDAPDNNLDGYNFWLSKLDQFGGNFVRAEMVKAFTSSAEYRRRFGQ